MKKEPLFLNLKIRLKSCLRRWIFFFLTTLHTYVHSTVIAKTLTSENSALAAEAGVDDAAKDGVVGARLARDGVAQPLEGVVTVVAVLLAQAANGQRQS